MLPNIAGRQSVDTLWEMEEGVTFILRFRASAKVPANSLVVSLVVKVTLYEMNFSS